MGRSSGSAESWADVKNMVAGMWEWWGGAGCLEFAYDSIERWTKRLCCRTRWRR